MSEYVEEWINEVHTLLLDTGRVFINGEIDEEQSLNFVMQIKYLVLKNFKEIYIYINSEGGEVEAAMAIIDEIEIAIKNGVNVVTICAGKAYSCGAFILIYGNERYATKHSSIMIHPVQYELYEDYIKLQQKYSEFSIKQYEKFIKQIAKKCGNKTVKAVNKFVRDVDENIWVDVHSAIKMNIVDGIWTARLEKGIYEKEKN